METLMCSLAAILSVALNSAALAGSEKERQISGTVVERDEIVLVIEDSKKEQSTFVPKFLGNQRYQLATRMCPASPQLMTRCAMLIPAPETLDRSLISST